MKIGSALMVMALAMTGMVTTPARAQNPPVTIAAVGDIACDPDEPAFNGGLGTPAGCQQKAVGDTIRAMNPQAFLALGDLQYIDGSYDKFMSSYDPALGDLKPITFPIPGNHEYNTPKGAGYYQYFGEAAHPQTKGNYSFNLGAWHIIGINSTTCTPTNPCGPGSTMAKWIAADVAANPSQCLMAMWHHPLWSAGLHGAYTPMLPVWNQLNSYGADVVLNGHDHLYQRSKPLGSGSLNPDGSLGDPVVTQDGIVEFIVGTGGENNFEALPGNNPAVTAAMDVIATNPNPGLFGPLKMVLGDTGYDYEFVPSAGSTPFQESGSRGCRTKTPPTDIPSVPSVSVTRSGDGTVTVAWQAQRFNDRLPVTYTAQIVGRARNCVSTATSCVISGLTNGQTYSVAVRASNDVAEVSSTPVEFVPAMPPSRTGIPTATTNGEQVTVSWPATSYNGGLPVTYAVTSSPGTASCTTAATSCTMRVDPGVYRFNVVAVNEVGTSAVRISDPVSVGLPGPPTISGLTRAGDGKISVSLTPPADPGTRPIVDYLVTSSPGAKTCATATGTCTVTGLTNGTSYTFTAVARTSTLTSAPSTPSAALIAARVPVRTAAPTVAAAGSGAVALTWAPTTYDGGLPVTGYEVLIGNGPTVVCRTTALSCTATGLTAGTSYWFTVVAINEAGRSANSPGSLVIKVS